MSVFRNIKKEADLWLSDPNGSRIHVRPRDTFTGSNYFKRYTAAEAPTPEEILLELIEDDGAPYQEEANEIPNLLRSWEFTVSPTETWADHVYVFTNSNLLGTEALFLQIIVDDAPIDVKVNNDDNSVFTMDADSTQVFNTGELLISQVAFRNTGATGGLPAVVRLLAATVSGR